MLGTVAGRVSVPVCSGCCWAVATAHGEAGAWSCTRHPTLLHGHRTLHFTHPLLLLITMLLPLLLPRPLLPFLLLLLLPLLPLRRRWWLLLLLLQLLWVAVRFGLRLLLLLLLLLRVPSLRHVWRHVSSTRTQVHALPTWLLCYSCSELLLLLVLVCLGLIFFLHLLLLPLPTLGALWGRLLLLLLLL